METPGGKQSKASILNLEKTVWVLGKTQSFFCHVFANDNRKWETACTQIAIIFRQNKIEKFDENDGRTQEPPEKDDEARQTIMAPIVLAFEYSEN